MIIQGPLLVVSPHPDDDVIGCGGLIQQAVAQGEFVHTVHLTSGENGAPGTAPAVVLEWRERDARAAGELLGIGRIEFFEEPDGALLPTASVVDRLADYIAFHRPRTILIPHPLESHPDHNAATLAVQALGPLAGVDVLTYEVWTPMPIYAYVVDISEQMERKVEAIRLHESQVYRVKFDEAILGLNRYRGELHNRPHGPYAEVYGRMG